jgi:hypothetical protein
MGRLPSGNEKTIKEEVPTKPKQLWGHVAIDEQQSSMAFSEGSFLCGQQSMSSMEADMFDISADFTVTAAPLAIGSMATDSAINRIRMVRPRCMWSVLPG